MPRHRMQDDAPVRLPRPAAPEIRPGAFMLYPMSAVPGNSPEQWQWQEHLYRFAFEQAQAVARPSILERDLLAVWN